MSHDYDSISAIDYQGYEARRQAQQESAQAFERRLCNALAALAATPDGLAFLRWCIDMSGILKALYPGDHAQAAYHEGQRSMGAQLIALARKAEVLPEILKEENPNG